jgi:hypothetical protein
VKMGPIRCPETSVNNYHTTPRNIPEERKSQNILSSLDYTSVPALHKMYLIQMSGLPLPPKVIASNLVNCTHRAVGFCLVIRYKSDACSVLKVESSAAWYTKCCCFMQGCVHERGADKTCVSVAEVL